MAGAANSKLAPTQPDIFVTVNSDTHGYTRIVATPTSFKLQYLEVGRHSGTMRHHVMVTDHHGIISLVPVRLGRWRISDVTQYFIICNRLAPLNTSFSLVQGVPRAVLDEFTLLKSASGNQY